ncbi:lamin tail domain-containing protein [Halorubrum distributum]
MIVTAPDDELGGDEVAAIEDFRDDGGAVILASAGAGTDDAADARDNLDALAADLGSDLRTGDAVTDEENNLGGPENPTTTNFDTDFDLFGAYGDGDDGGDGGSSVDLAVDELVADPEGDQTEDEYVSFVNQGDETVDLDGYVVDDEVDNSYTFSGISVDPGATITLYTGTGDDTEDTVYWGRGSPVWNNGGDTVFVTGPDGNTVVEYGY